MSKRKTSNVGDLTQLAKDLEAVFEQHFGKRPAIQVFWAGVTAHEHGLYRHHNPYRQLPETEQYASDWDNGWNHAAAQWRAQVDEMDLGGLDERL